MNHPHKQNKNYYCRVLIEADNKNIFQEELENGFHKLTFKKVEVLGAGAGAGAGGFDFTHSEPEPAQKCPAPKHCCIYYYIL